MKNKILIICMSFIFLSIYSSNVLANTNEKIEIDIMKENKNVQNSIHYSGMVYIDMPSNHMVLLRPECEKIEIAGWAVSEDKEAIVRVLVDGTVVGNADRVKREDVDEIISPQYGGISMTPKAGFYYSLDVVSLTAGNHQITVQEVSKYGDVIGTSNVAIQMKNKQYQGEIYVDIPILNEVFVKPDKSQVEIAGWAVSEDKEAIVRVLVDGTVVGNADRVKREDVDEIISPQYGGISMTPKAGFYYSLDVVSLTAGNHQITVQEVSRYGDVICSFDRQIKIKNKQYLGTAYIDAPKSNEVFVKPDKSQVEIAGWAVSEDKEAIVRVLVDGTVVGNADRVKREDVDEIISPQYGGISMTPKAGFYYSLDVVSLTAGNHQMTVQEVSRYGDVIASTEMVIVVQNKQYRGEMYLDTPQNGVTLVKQEVSNIEIGGWAVSRDKEAIVRILLDGNRLLNSCNRSERLDVDNSVSLQYGGSLCTPKAGFCYTMNVSSLTIGVHILRIEQISRWGDLISVFETQINIVNKQYLGEMCLDYPKNGTVEKIGENLIVDGWAVAQDEAASVEIYIDGVFKETAQRYYRPDVVHYMNKYDGKTVNAGFGKLINTSGMSIGTHTVTVYEKSRYGDIIGGVGATFMVKSNQVVNNNDNHNNNNNSDNSNPVINSTTNVSGTKGIDVSQFQGAINWKSVADSDIKYAMIRIGYRGYGGGGLAEDSKFKKNFTEAVASGLKVGIYFYSAAINATEAKKDAEYIVAILRKYGYQNKVSMPIAIDLELIPGVATRDRNVSKATRTNIANTFCQTIANYGYTPMIYANKSFLNSNLNCSQIPYDIWVAQYNSKCTYTGSYTMWQYSSSGRVSGISGNVDCNICYKNY